MSNTPEDVECAHLVHMHTHTHCTDTHTHAHTHTHARTHTEQTALGGSIICTHHYMYKGVQHTHTFKCIK